MAQGRTFKSRCVVLRKVKLGEKDVIVTLLAESGELLRAVAKGARKPGGSYSSRIELFSVVDCMFAKGRSLDVVADARFAKGFESRSWGLEQTFCASAVAELIAHTAQEGLEHPRLFDMVVSALSHIAEDDAHHALAICVSCLMKVLASAGFRPSFDVCVSCGASVDLSRPGALVPVSFADGGVYCAGCRQPADSVRIEAGVLDWTRALLFARFDEIEQLEIPDDVLFGMLHFARTWALVHTGRNLKSIDSLISSGLFA